MGRLEYDDGAFAYFGLTFLFLITIPYSYYYFKSISAAKNSTAVTDVDQVNDNNISNLVKTNNIKPRSSLEAGRISQARSSGPSVGSVFNGLGVKKIVSTVVLLLLWSALYHYFLICYNGETQISQFDPYEILDVSRDATERDIKKKYRKLSIQWHPDQWATKSLEEKDIAEAKFIRIAKAYTALTDEVSKENYKKYGNPDGPQPMELSLGLPSFLLDKQNHNVVLLLYIIVLVVVIPTVVFVYYTNSKRYSDKLILNETYQVLAYMLLPQTTMKHLIDVLALSAEFRRLIDTNAEVDDLFIRFKKLLLKNGCLPKKPVPSAANLFKKWPGNEKVYLILQAYFHRALTLNQNNPSKNMDVLASLSATECQLLRDTLHKVLVLSPKLVDAMTEVATMRRSLKLLHKVVTFRQCLLQAVYPYSPSFLLLIEGMDKEQALLKKLTTKVASFDSFDKTGMLDPEFSGSAFNIKVPDEVSKAARLLLDKSTGIRAPYVSASIGCLDIENKKNGRILMEDKFGEKDVVTVYVVLNFSQEDFKDSDEISKPEFRLAFAPYFPLFFKESFSVSVGVNGNDEHLLASTKVVIEKEVTRVKLMFKPDFKKPGNYNFDLYVKSRTCLGIDKVVKMPLTVISQSEIEAYAIHPEDVEVQNSPGLFDVFDTVAEEDSDFESDGEGSSEQKGKEVKKKSS